MRRALRLVISLAIAVTAVYLLRGHLQSPGERSPARLDRGVAVDGERGRIDPHGPAADRPLSPFTIEARIENSVAGEYRVEVLLASETAFDSVSVLAARFDRADVAEAAWSSVVWSGRLEANVETRFEVRVPFGPTTPVRLQLRAQAVGADGARHTATAILRPEPAKP